MEKLQLKLHHKQHRGSAGTLGMGYCLNALKDSDDYEIEYHEDYLKTSRDVRGTIIYCNDKKIYLDLWEYPTPTYTVKAYNAGFDLIIKMQHRIPPYPNVKKYLNRKKILPLPDEELKPFLDKIVPWTFFPSRMFLPHLNKEEDLWGGEVDQIGFFCGKPWKCRNKISQNLVDQGIEVTKSSQEKKSGRPLSKEEFMDNMSRSKYGIVLCGRGSPVTDFKNRREADYMMMKKPLLLNYKPNYYNELIEGKHYIYFDAATDISKLEEKYDIQEIAENGYQWYVENIRPDGAAKVFRQIMSDRFNI